MPMDDTELEEAVRHLVGQMDLTGKRIVVLVPDRTRTAPVRRVAGMIDAAIAGRAAEVTWMVALGTHQPMADEALARHLGPVSGRVLNHAWWDPDALVSVGDISGTEVAAITGGRLHGDIDVRLNRAVVEADVALVCGPVFPHEVVGFSGGNKYFYPGVAGQEIIDATHWLGALITSSALIGPLGPNPVRALIDRAATLIPAERWCVAMVVAPGSDALVACATGRPEEAWAEAASVSARTHVRELPAPVRMVLSVMPERYEDLWTAAKGMYKVEPVVADGGEVIIFAPHVSAISVTHGDALARIGYHVRDYFLGDWDRYSSVPGSVLAHSTHVSGLGTWSSETGEQRRISVTLATGIDEATCVAHGLGYRDPAGMDLAAWADRAERHGDVLVVADAGEMLYRLAK
jgi:nickel-dependent lactate racemase